jgi:hypothetical protein
MVLSKGPPESLDPVVSFQARSLDDLTIG